MAIKWIILFYGIIWIAEIVKKRKKKTNGLFIVEYEARSVIQVQFQQQRKKSTLV
jgi:hypothetical protein